MTLAFSGCKTGHVGTCSEHIVLDVVAEPELRCA